MFEREFSVECFNGVGSTGENRYAFKTFDRFATAELWAQERLQDEQCHHVEIWSNLKTGRSWELQKRYTKEL